MLEIRFHGRGGQGVVTASEILAQTLIYQEKYAQYSPDFGVERRGAPLRAFLRIDDKEIYLKCQIYTPDCVVVFDPSLIEKEEVTSGLKSNGWLIINSPKDPKDFKKIGPFRIATVNATEIALKHGIGTETSPIVNTVMSGAAVKILGLPFESLILAIRERFKDEKNIVGAREAFETVRWTDGKK